MESSVSAYIGKRSLAFGHQNCLRESGNRWRVPMRTAGLLSTMRASLLRIKIKSFTQSRNSKMLRGRQQHSLLHRCLTGSSILNLFNCHIIRSVARRMIRNLVPINSSSFIVTVCHLLKYACSRPSSSAMSNYRVR